MSTSTFFVILAAGMGTRLGRTLPKTLTELDDGRTILQQQLDNIVTAFGSEALKRVRVVVGYKPETIIDVLPRTVMPVYNPHYDVTNTSKSLLLALRNIKKSNGVIWMNGDVVFSPLVLGRAMNLIEKRESFMAVLEGQCGDEEMKYSLDEHGNLSKVSKTNEEGLGEAVGINYIAPADRLGFETSLAHAEPQDYFEAAIEDGLSREAIWKPLLVNGLYAVEVDFVEDLEKANKALLQKV